MGRFFGLYFEGRMGVIFGRLAIGVRYIPILRGLCVEERRGIINSVKLQLPQFEEEQINSQLYMRVLDGKGPGSITLYLFLERQLTPDGYW